MVNSRWLYAILLLACPVLLSAQDIRPDPNWKGSVSDGFSIPSSWMDYWPTAKVGDYVTQQDRFGKRHDEVVEVTKDTITVARVILTGRSGNDRREIRFKYKAQPQKAPAKNTKTRSASSFKGKSAIKQKQPSTEKIMVGEQELECRVDKSGTITRWYSPLLPFDGMVKEKSPDGSFTVIDFGRGK